MVQGLFLCLAVLLSRRALTAQDAEGWRRTTPKTAAP